MTSIPSLAHQSPDQRLQEFRSLANKIEAQFLAEMLTSAGIGKQSETFGGGIGEDQFSSFLTREYANAAVEAGGIGLSEAIFQALAQTENLT